MTDGGIWVKCPLGYIGIFRWLCPTMGQHSLQYTTLAPGLQAAKGLMNCRLMPLENAGEELPDRQVEHLCEMLLCRGLEAEFDRLQLSEPEHRSAR